MSEVIVSYIVVSEDIYENGLVRFDNEKTAKMYDRWMQRAHEEQGINYISKLYYPEVN